ncbi:MAG: LytTR family transcriptional regulator [Devosia sp.]|uniref:LytTR family DNA-binding domain-containing protein n=1 Tax=Devosia sp. TaxID=1871048 RepID=UPI0024C6F709|nr:LytTR family DNA-binding domain-containing protein [Devosia sp.]UYN99222.1 MAG: LytTR family transcriptional regulator [Devosia sp.]
MNDRPLHSTLREMRDISRDGRVWVALLLLGLVAGLVGPFGTFENMAPLPRIAYWIAIVTGTGAIGTLIAGWVERALADRLPPLPAAGLAGAIAGPPIALAVVLLNMAMFGTEVTVIGLAPLIFYCTLISAAVTVLGAVFARKEPVPVSGAEGGVAEAPAPALLERLPRPQRGRLLHIAVSDHYVDVTTDKGTVLVLMRLSDAIRETSPTAGLQVHRSHWVALDAIRRALRSSGKPMLELENGVLVPVSRTFMPAAKAAGLFGAGGSGPARTGPMENGDQA